MTLFIGDVFAETNYAIQFSYASNHGGFSPLWQIGHPFLCVAVEHLYIRNPLIYLSFLWPLLLVDYHTISCYFGDIRHGTIDLNTPSRDLIFLDIRRMTYIPVN